MKANCPTCNAEVEFRFDDSFVRICGSCRSAVLRGDRGVETLGKVADLVPTESPLRLFAEGRFGSATFLLVGMAQLQHGSGGLWQEWYAKLDAGNWAWLSEAQGRLYLTFERADAHVPPFESLAPGGTIAIGGHDYTVGEVGIASYASALGEIPYRLDPAAQFRFADLSDGQGGFATVDYGEAGDEPKVYVGQQVTFAELAIRGGEEQFDTERRKQGIALACPSCGGALELRVPDQSLRIACPYCDHLLDVQHGNLSVLAKLNVKASPRIPLGTTVTFSEGALTVIGYLQRSANIGTMWYPFYEYLLYAPAIGFRWLVQSDGHWSYVQPVATGAVELGPRYHGVAFEHYQVARIRVGEVLGELYWKVEVGEEVMAEDYIAPPAMLSSETTPNEQTWSLSTYVSKQELLKALGRDDLDLDTPVGIAPNQPYPLHGIGYVALIAFALLFGIGFVRSQGASNDVKYQELLAIPNGPAATPLGDPAVAPLPTGATPEAPSNIVFTPPFELAGGKNIEIHLATSLTNNWAYVAVDLVNETTGAIVGFDQNLEYYSGVEGGESWSEGSNTGSQFLAPMEAGRYVMRFEGQHGGTGDLALRVTVRQDVFRTRYFLFALGGLCIPFLGVLFHSLRFKKKRWENSNVRPPSGSEDE